MKLLDLGKDVDRPRILLLDFDKSDAQVLRDAGSKVYSGTTGIIDGVLNIPVEPHRVDIVVYRCSYPPLGKIKDDETIRLWSFAQNINYGRAIIYTPSIANTSQCDLSQLLDLGGSVLAKGGFSLVFIGNRRIREDNILLKRLLSVAKDAPLDIKDGGQEGQYDLRFNNGTDVESMGVYIENILKGKKGHSVKSITGIPAGYFNPDTRPDSTFIVSDEKDFIYASFMRLKKGSIAFLPDYGSANIGIVKEVLAMVREFCPTSLFSKSYQKDMWLEADGCRFHDEHLLIEKKESLKEKMEIEINAVEKERQKIRANTDCFRAILSNGDDDKVEPEEQLKPFMGKVLEWLGIKVIDVDAIREKKKEPLINDFMLQDEGKEILCEVKGVKNGPRGEYVGQVKSHIIRHSKLTNKPTQPGILILNYQRDRAPNERDPFYTDEAVLQEAKDSEIGLLDTRELFNICKTIYGHKDEPALKKKARALIMSTHGVIQTKDLKL